MSQTAGRIPSVREELQREPICMYCKQPITGSHKIYKRLDSGEAAHLACYVDNMDKEEKEPSP